jgi:hypothetical protein
MILQIASFFLVPSVISAATLTTTKKKRGAHEKSSSRHDVSSWAFKFKKLVTCVFDGSQFQEPASRRVAISKGSYHRRWIDCSGSGLCNIRDVVHGNTRVMHRSGDISPQAAATSTSSHESSCTCIQSSVCQKDPSRSNVYPEWDTRLLNASSRRSKSAHFLLQKQTGEILTRGSSSMSLSRRWSGCYEFHLIFDPIEAFSFPASICPCPSCGQIFTNTEDLAQHQAIKHAVLVLGDEDSARTVVEIIFQSSWLKKENPICKIERILKIHNSQKTISKFEEYRNMVKAKAGNKLLKKDPRCIADGNELLRFHCATFACSLGINAECSSLCNLPSCNICNVIRNGFSPTPKLEIAGTGKGSWVYTTASSGKAHDWLTSQENGKGKRNRAMLVCRMIAGRVKKSQDEDDFIAGGFDSIAGQAGLYSNLEELFVYNPCAVLPCFVVIYQTL